MKQELKILPNHIGFIIDGNGRWAKKRGLPRSAGHKAGSETLSLILKECFYTYNIPVVSIYAFSSENWKRPKQEIDYLMSLFEKYTSDDFIKEFPGVKLNIMGDESKFSSTLASQCQKTASITKNNYKYILNLGINYSGQDEIVNAFNSIIKKGIKSVDRETIKSHLYTSGQPELDFVVRTSGEQRLSNFMLWQIAYAELYFPKTYWPSFNKKQLHEALIVFQSRNRRFGEVK